MKLPNSTERKQRVSGGSWSVWRNLIQAIKLNHSGTTGKKYSQVMYILNTQLAKPFFDAKHIKQNKKDFVQNFFIKTTSRYEDLNLNDFKGLEEAISDLNDTITEGEVSRTLRTYTCNTKSFNNASFYPSILSRLGAIAIHALTHSFNGCLETSAWVWRAAKIIFLRKEGKTSNQRTSITSLIGKVPEKLLANT